jgi:hypothetical protein
MFCLEMCFHIVLMRKTQYQVCSEHKYGFTALIHVYKIILQTMFLLITSRKKSHKQKTGTIYTDN